MSLPNRTLLTEHTVGDLSQPVRLQDHDPFPVQLPSRASLRKAIKRGDVYVNEAVGKTGTFLQPGDVLRLYEPSGKLPKALPLELPTHYRDDHLWIIEKPPGLPVSGNTYRTVQNALMYQYQPPAVPGALRVPRPQHRLDADTRGLLIVARTALAQQRVGQAFQEGKIKKTYHAVAHGACPVAMDIRLPLEGRAARTEVARLQTAPSKLYGAVSLLKIRLHTGRTHQIRKHHAALGHPLLGDRLYAPAAGTARGKGLHLAATRLVFVHPVSGEALDIALPVPERFLKRMEREQMRAESA